MKPYLALTFLISAVFPAAGADQRTTKPAAAATPTAKSHEPTTKPTAKLPSAEPEQAISKRVEVSERDVVPITTRLNFATMIVLSKGEQILEYICGDKEYWVLQGTQNFALIKPAKAGAQTNMHLITASGNVYSFVVTERGDNIQPDLKVFVEPKGGMASATPRFVATEAVEGYRRRAENAELAVKKAQDDAVAQAAAAKAEIRSVSADYPRKLIFDYKYRNEPGFNVTAIFHDDRFTFIRANPQELPAIYEMKDGKPALIEAHYADGLYTIPKIVDSGYLSIGKKRMAFERETAK